MGIFPGLFLGKRFLTLLSLKQDIFQKLLFERLRKGLLLPIGDLDEQLDGGLTPEIKFAR